jgi:hypothetical protein
MVKPAGVAVKVPPAIPVIAGLGFVPVIQKVALEYVNDASLFGFIVTVIVALGPSQLPVVCDT